MIKKLCLVSLLLISSWPEIYSMEERHTKIYDSFRWCLIYIHGYGETVSTEEEGYKVKFPEDGSKMGDFVDITKSSFYTKQNVITALLFFKKKVVEEGHNAFEIRARSNGGGVFINCLYFLHHYDNHQEYFKGTNITKEDAEAIINAINNGRILITVPFLSLYNALLLHRLSIIGGYGTATLLIYYGYKNFGHKFNIIFLLPIFYILSQLSTVASQASSEKIIVPKITHYSYDPTHIKPIKAVEYLKNKIKCPVLLHICQNDGVLKGPNQDTVTLFENIREGNETNTFIALTDDDSHNRKGQKITVIENAFLKYATSQKDMHFKELKNAGCINDVDALKNEIGWPVRSLLNFSYKKPTIVLQALI